MKNTKVKERTHTGDLPDKKKDLEKMQPEETEMQLPDANDIPGQEHVHVPPLGELADTTISSADEEGEGIEGLHDDNSDDPFLSNVTKEEKEALADAAAKLPTRDQDNLDRAKLQQTDDEGEPLNEKTNQSGSDLDVPGSEADDHNEAIGEEDEENNPYSLGGEEEDDSINKV